MGRTLDILDETLRDGLQSPSVTEPSIDDKIELLELMPRIGVSAVNLGLPAASARAFDHVVAMASHIARRGLALEACCAVRTHQDDVARLADAVQLSGHPIVACCFAGASPLRRFAEGWDLDRVLDGSSRAMDLARREGLRVAFVTEDTVRSPPSLLSTLFRLAIDHGAERLVLCDTVGHADAVGTRALVGWTRAFLSDAGAPLAIEWHGHNDRGLALSNAFVAIDAGVSRVHACGLGIGERVGNTSMEGLVLGLNAFGWRDQDLSALPSYVNKVSAACSFPIPPDHPLRRSPASGALDVRMSA